MTNLREKGNEDWRWMELTEDKDCELQEGDLYIGFIEPSCSITREFLVEGSCHGLILCTIFAAA
jgi:hypothetical protein